MGLKSSIEWTESTWNPVTGCTKISEGCAHCYAERMARRLKAMGQRNYANGFQVTLHPHALPLPLTWKKPQTIFVNSMSDLFHKDVPQIFIRQVFEVMEQAHWHRFQVLTKRAERLFELTDSLNWPGNVWMGVTVENASYLNRIDYLRKISAAVRFLSLEPLLGPLPIWICPILTGLLSAAKAAPRPAQWLKNGFLIFRNNAVREMCRSFLNNGVA